jgi:hypothetical protein
MVQCRSVKTTSWLGLCHSDRRFFIFDIAMFFRPWNGFYGREVTSEPAVALKWRKKYPCCCTPIFEKEIAPLDHWC